MRKLTLLAALSLFSNLHAQTAAELLEKGIYTQETVGDIDAAIRIYQQVVALGTESRTQAAQAQYRLGLCLLRKGSQAEAAKAFDKLIADYPEQKELVAAARQQNPGAGLKLIAPPWTEGEMLRLKLKLPTGLAVGMFLQTVEKSSAGSFVITTRTHTPGATHFSRSEADLDTMRPKTSYFRHTMLGEYKLAYGAKQAKVEANGKEAKSIDLSQFTIDNEAAIPAMRRLPLAEGYKAQLDVMSPLGTALMQIAAEVTAIEEIATAAGKFRSFKVELSPIRQTFWFSADSHRYLTKMEVNGAVGELEEITRMNAPPVTVKNATHPVSISLPSGWTYLEADPSKPRDFYNAGLFDTEAKCSCAVWAGKIERDLRTDMTAKEQDRIKHFKNYKIRPDSWTPRQVNGAEALSVVADYEEHNRPMAEYVTIFKQGNNGAVLFARVPAADLASFRPQFDRIIDSLRLQ